MKIHLLKFDNDDENFIRIVENIINKSISSFQPNEIYVVRIDQWFDHKWQGFSGKISGVFGVRGKILTIPPFIPDRVIEQLHFQKIGKNYQQQKAENLHIYQESGENLQRKIRHLTNSASFFWFSGNVANNSQASLMNYQIKDQAENGWYVSFLEKETWQVYKTNNISRNEVLALID
jgi:hypothetical protein